MAIRHTRKKKLASQEDKIQQEFILRRLRIEKPPFRKLKNIAIEFAPRITLIAGHNGIGKSTILALVANGSGLTESEFVTYSGRPFTGLLNEIIHIDFESEFLVHQTAKTLSNPIIDYDINGSEFSKRCALTKRTVKNRDGKTTRLEARVVPRNIKDSPHEDQKSGVTIGVAAKVPIPTIYLGMTRMIPIGESDPELIENSADTAIDQSDADFIEKFIQDIIRVGPKEKAANSTITTQAIKGTTKTSKHPKYPHSPKSVSLGQDSLSSIATAFASFRKLDREWPDYPGGLLVIDELDAGLHPHAQQSLMEGIKNAAKILRVQVIATTHSLCMIETIHPENNIILGAGARMDSVIYIMDSVAPRVTKDLSFDQIQNDMTLTAPKPIAKPVKIDNTLKIYLEDAEANFILGNLLTRKIKLQINKATGKTLKAIPISVGCNNLQGLQKFDNHFKKVLIVVDADSAVTDGLKNVVKLPGGADSTGNGFSPERTIYEFILELIKDTENFPETRRLLQEQNITRNQLSVHLMKGETNIKDRVSSKKWMKSHLSRISDWDLVGHWLREHPEKVTKFQQEFLAAAIATAKAMN